MDPQRQYAQLLTLWSQGSKLFRRDRHYRRVAESDWEAWWKLGRRLVERQLIVLPVPGRSFPVLLVGGVDFWITLVDERFCAQSDVFLHGIGIIGAESGALRWDGHWTLQMELALRLGERGWKTLMHWPHASQGGVLEVSSIDESLTLLGALRRNPRVMDTLSMEDWVLASHLIRHPRIGMASDHGLSPDAGFRYDVETGILWWTGQDEDSVQ